MCVEVPHLRYVVAAAEHRSFRRAATAVNITQPTLSKRVRELEDRLGVLLFERSTGGAHLTPIGEEFVQSARRVLTELELMENRARAGKRSEAGRLEIGFYTSLSTGALRDSILSFVARHAQVEVNITEDTSRRAHRASRPRRDRLGCSARRTRLRRLCPYGVNHGGVSARSSARRARFSSIGRT